MHQNFPYFYVVYSNQTFSIIKKLILIGYFLNRDYFQIIEAREFNFILKLQN